MMKTVFVLLLLMSGSVYAQAPNIKSYKQEVFAPGVSTVTGSPLLTVTYQAAAVLCGQVPFVPPATVKNPTQIEFDDVASVGKACIASLTSTFLPSMPTGTGFLTTLSQTDDVNQTSPRSTPANPFATQPAPSAPVNVKVG